MKANNIQVVIFDKAIKSIKFEKQIELNTDFNDFENIINEIRNILKGLIIEIEKEISISVNNFNLVIQSPLTLRINACIRKNFDKSNIDKNQIEYLIQDLKQQILKNNNQLKINHIIVKDYFLDGKKIHSPPYNQICNDLIIHSQFICFPKDLITSLENLFKDHQVEFSSILCANYIESSINFGFASFFECAIAIKNGYNSNEVQIAPKKLVKMGFFERLFHTFS